MKSVPLNENMPEIDLIYTWVNDNDPAWQARHNAFTGMAETKADGDCKGRFANNDELKYSLRAVEKYAPWIRHIYIVTDQQIPQWLNTENRKIRIVDHKDFIPSQSLPCFNSRVIEHCLWRISDLAEHFLYANDDMFLNRPVSPSVFYDSDGLPFARFRRSRFNRFSLWFKEKILRKPLSSYNMAIRNSARLVKQKYGIYFGEKSHHNIDAYLKSDYRHVADVFNKEIEQTMTNHLRSSLDLQRNLYYYVALAEKRAHRQYVNRKTSFMLRIHKEKRYRDLEKLKPLFFCMNDSQYATDADRKRVTEYLQKRFPEKSSFER